MDKQVLFIYTVRAFVQIWINYCIFYLNKSPSKYTGEHFSMTKIQFIAGFIAIKFVDCIFHGNYGWETLISIYNDVKTYMGCPLSATIILQNSKFNLNRCPLLHFLLVTAEQILTLTIIGPINITSNINYMTHDAEYGLLYMYENVVNIYGPVTCSY